MVKRDLITMIFLTMIAFLLAVGLRIFVFEPYTVTKEQSNSYLKSNDYVVASQLSTPEYKKFVLYEVDGKEYIGRIVAKEGDVPIYMDDIFYLNNQVESQSYLDDLRKSHFDLHSVDIPFTADFTLASLTNGAEEKIPKNQFLILNDDRQNTQDSRTFGLIKKSQLRGVVSFRLLPLKDFGFVEVE
ncbi:signal peptidase I [Streptococcus sp. S784/96/1]|uniref:signal peptidase I n=1 Tax=Streptococcus sp. S784/96/1 TaxID=2653499 RepID=UPI001386D476|nr:signal peptidase I [Streptococcus sp. S784/96/1]